MRDQLAVLDLLDATGLREERDDVGRDERLAVADPEHERALQAGADDQVGVQRRDDDEGEVADELAVGLAHRLDEVAVVVVLDQVRNHLGVGLATRTRGRRR